MIPGLITSTTITFKSNTKCILSSCISIFFTYITYVYILYTEYTYINNISRCTCIYIYIISMWHGCKKPLFSNLPVQVFLEQASLHAELHHRLITGKNHVRRGDSPYETPPLKRCETTSKFDQSVELFGWNVLWTIFQQESGLIRNSMKFTKWNCWCFIWSCLGCFSPLKIWLLIKWDRFYPKRYYNMFEGTWRHYIDHSSKGWSFLQESQWKPSVPWWSSTKQINCFGVYTLITHH